MSAALILKLLGLVVAVVAMSVLVQRTRSFAARVLLAILLLPVAAFCLFGFVATFEPLDLVTQWTFRIGYAVLGISAVASIARLSRGRTGSSPKQKSGAE